MRTRLLEDGSSSADANRIVADVDDRMGDCILRLYRLALNVGREWQPGLTNITAPTLILQGLKDRPVPPELAGSHPGARGSSARRTTLVSSDPMRWQGR
ncbi:hypothetical protein SAMN03159496_05857 [Rhizobium sp. NFR07]|uniref:hypothetical protein n=1 Tax=Rhizobium sp. NFR07 TaxID=1566262 RepID=UPI0008E45ABE|nr:hypothetical protein [Rhizobium sp. NFR07]SFB61609.1 hypothetical protein SAMN03159496_05857 [Rhizobium sp. NFR07]